MKETHLVCINTFESKEGQFALSKLKSKFKNYGYIESCNVLGSRAKRFIIETAENTTREKIRPFYSHLQMNECKAILEELI